MSNPRLRARYLRLRAALAVARFLLWCAIEEPVVEERIRERAS